MADINLLLTFRDDDIPEGVDPAAWATSHIADSLRDTGRVEPAGIVGIAGRGQVTVETLDRLMVDDPDGDLSLALRLLLIYPTEWTVNDLVAGIDYGDLDRVTLEAMLAAIEALDREALTTLLLEYSLCPLHQVDYAICFDDEDPECAAIRLIHPFHDT